jgi:hypothetical protein
LEDASLSSIRQPSEPITMSDVTRAKVMALLTEDAPPARRRLIATALQPAFSTMTKAAEAMPEERLHELIAASRVIEAVVRLMEAASLTEAVQDPLAQARARAAGRRAQLLEAAGGVLERKEVMARTGMSHQTISNWRRNGDIIALQRGMRDFVYPACQFTDTGLVPGLTDVLRATALHDPWSQLGVLLTPSDRLNGRTPLAALHAGDASGALAVAQTAGTVGDEGAPRISHRVAVPSR